MSGPGCQCGGGYGQADGDFVIRGSDLQNLLPTLAESAGAFQRGQQDPVTRAAVLEGQLRDAVARGAPAAKIRELQAKYAAAITAARDALEGRQATRQAQTVFQAVGISMTLLLLAMAAERIARAV